jgi:hypothetical protein
MLKEIELNQFTGTEEWHRHVLSGLLYTDGIKFVAEKAGAYWLIDKILLTVKHHKVFKKVAYQEFSAWTLHVKEDKTALLEAGDGNGNSIYKEELTYTDFPLNKITLWMENGVLILPSEH